MHYGLAPTVAGWLLLILVMAALGFPYAALAQQSEDAGVVKLEVTTHGDKLRKGSGIIVGSTPTGSMW